MAGRQIKARGHYKYPIFEMSKSIIEATKVAIELNGKIVPQNKYNIIKLKHNDKIEIVQFIGGG